MGQENSRPMGAGGRKLTRTKRMGLSCPNSTTWPRSARPAQRVPGVNLRGYRLALRSRGRPAPPLPRAYDIGTNMAVGYLERPKPSTQERNPPMPTRGGNGLAFKKGGGTKGSE